MSLGLATLARAYQAHFNTFKETVTFRGSTVSAMINRVGDKFGGGRESESLTQDGAVIELQVTNMLRPLRGEIIVDSQGISHRIEQDADYLGHCWRCRCSTHGSD